MSIKYYHLAKDEELPDEFCAIRDVGGEPSEYTFYAPEAENAKLRQQLADVTESMGRVEERCAKLRELVRDYECCTMHADCSRCEYDGKLSTHCPLSPCFPDTDELRELGVEVDG